MRIEFYLISAMEIAHFAPVVRALRKLGADAIFVSAQKSPKAEITGWDDADVIEATVVKTGLPLQRYASTDADVVITTQSEEHVAYCRGLKIRMMYGVGLVAPEKTHLLGGEFDYHLVHGPLTERIQFSQHSVRSPDLPASRVKVIGYPKFDEWFKQPNNYWNMRNDGQVRIASGRPVLLWLPTWGEKSSITHFTHAIYDLSDKYDIWVRPHHGTVFWEKERFEYLKQGPIRVLDFTDPPEPAFAAASVVLADLSSGAFSEAIFLGKEVVGLTSEEDVGRLLIPNVRKTNPCVTTPDSLSLAIRVISGQGALPAGMRDELVTSTHGHDAERAARIILNCAVGESVHA